jgi:glycosyltransferase involved in cell wall biosynthesis/SAM-dependent methyltransferase
MEAARTNDARDGEGAESAREAVAFLETYELKRLGWVRERAGKLAAGTRVLDVGFGAPEHREIFSHCDYSTFDLVAFLESARGGRGRNLYRIPIADASFDVVMCRGVFDWALYPEPALREIVRTMAPGGALWVAPPPLAAPAGSPPRASSGLSFAWYAAAFARQGLEIGDAFASYGLFGELCAICLDAGHRLNESTLNPDQRARLEDMLLRDLPPVFAELENNVVLDSPRAGIILEAKRSPIPIDIGDTAPAGASDARADTSVRVRLGKRPLRITYLITSILGVTGGNMTLLNQVEALRRRGHAVTIVTYSGRPTWTDIVAPVVHVPRHEPMASHVPESDVVVGTYFQNAHELPAISAGVKLYYAQGDQFVFDDDTPFPNREAESVRQALKASSLQSYRLPGVHFIANSHNLADAVRRAHGVTAERVLPVCTDQTVFRPVGRSAPGSRPRILVVGPDTRGAGVESLAFKGIADIRRGLEILGRTLTSFTTVRVSNTGPDIFQGFPCEYHYVPSDEMKTFLFGTADILVYASHFDSCPRPPQEGMAAGAAVVCTATSGAKEYCGHEENCLLVPIKDPPAIAAAISRIVGDRALHHQIVEGGKKTAAAFPREREWNELEALMYEYAEKAGVLEDS